MKKGNAVLFLFLVITNLYQICGANCLTKVFFHQGLYVDKLVFYFDKKPHMRAKETVEACRTIYKCEFSCTNSLDPSSEERMNHINKIQKKKAKSKNVPYRIVMNSSEKQCEKFMLTLGYDPGQISLEVNEFLTIGNRPAVVFSIIHTKRVKKYTSKRAKLRWKDFNAIKEDRKIRIVIDGGHGGSDAGACGKHGAVEKDIALAVSKQLAQELKKLDFEVKLTRTADTFVPLDERTALSNLIVEPDLFVSIHCNAAANAQAFGTETFYTSSFEGATEYDALAEMFSIQGKKLAESLQNGIIEADDQKVIKNRGVKQAFSQVLMGSEAPAALVELGFVTNDAESKRLMDPEYQRQLVQGMVEGITSYIKEN